MPCLPRISRANLLRFAAGARDIFQNLLVVLFAPLVCPGSPASPGSAPSKMKPLPLARPHGPRRLLPARIRRSLGAAMGLGLMFPATLSAAEAVRRSFDIPAGDAATTLKQFAVQSIEQLLYSPDDVTGVQTHAVRGELTPLAALARMLEQTPLKARQDETTKAIAITANRPSRAPPAAVPAPPPDPPKTNQPKHNESLPVKNRNLLSFLTGWLAAGTAVSAQTAPTPVKDEAVMLSAFEVSIDKDTGYQAGNTLAGSRLNSSLKDTAASVMVFTPEFLSDFGATSLEDMTAYAPNLQMDYQDATATATPSFLGGSNVTESRIRVRGLPASTALDFFETRIPVDSYRIGRFELSSGPNAILFGFAQPGGLVNSTTKKAEFLDTRSSVRASFGSWGHRRAEVGHNQIIVDRKLALRLDGVWEDSEGWRRWDFKKVTAGQAAVRYDPWKDTRVSVSHETGTAENHVNRPWNGEDQLALWETRGRTIKDANAFVTTTDRALGINRSTNIRNVFVTSATGGGPFLFTTSNANNFRILESTYEDLNLPATSRAGFTLLPRDQLPYNYSAWGPGSSRKIDFNRTSARIEQRLGRNGTLELAYNQEKLKSAVLTSQSTSATLYGDPNTTLPNPTGTGNPVPNANAGGLYLESQWGIDSGEYRNEVLRATLAWKLDFGRRWGRHQLAALAEKGELRDFRYPGREILVDDQGVPISSAAAPENANNLITRRRYVQPGSFSQYYPGDGREPISVTINGRTYHNTFINLNLNGGDILRTMRTYMLATQSYLWADRIVVTAGLRRDELQFDLHGGERLSPNSPLVTQGGQIANTWRFNSSIASSYKYEPTTGTLGGVYHVTPRLSLFANYADNVSQPTFNAVMLADRSLPAPPDGVTNDYGFMLNLLDGRLFLRATAFRTAFRNFPNITLSGSSGFDIVTPMSRVTQALFDRSLISQEQYNDHHLATAGNVRGYSDQKSEGYEATLAINLTKNLTGSISFSRTDYENSNVFLQFEDWFEQESRWLLGLPGAANIITTGGLTVAQELKAIPQLVADGRDFSQYSYGNRPNKANASGRYTFSSGRLKGSFFGGGLRWQSEPKLGRIVTGRRPDGGAIYGRDLIGPVDFKMDAFAGYRRSIKVAGRERKFSAQLNVRNVTDEDEWMPLRYNATFNGYSRVLLYEPRSVRFTVEIDF